LGLPLAVRGCVDYIDPIDYSDFAADLPHGFPRVSGTLRILVLPRT
jgi:hypothetical protein